MAKILTLLTIVVLVTLLSGTFAKRPTKTKKPNNYPTTQEDRDMSRFIQTQWDIDSAKAKEISVGQKTGADIVLNLGGRTSSRDRDDEASQRLFMKVNPSLLNHQTTKLLLSLYEEYHLSSSRKEYQNYQKIYQFLNAVIQTKIGKNLKSYLRSKGQLRSSYDSDLRDLLIKVWFDLYSRERGILGSNGFEHVFMGEVDDGEVKGMHNWIWSYQMEKKGILDYKGWTGTYSQNPFLIRGRFSVTNSGRTYPKPFTSFLIGASPEFEMALYTVAFLTHGNGEARFKLNGKNFGIRTYASYKRTSLASAYFI